MKALKIIGIVLLSLIVIVTVVVILLPSHAHVERSIVINAQPEQVYNEVNSYKNFNRWSPWASLDPNTKYEYTGPESGVGAFMRWESNNNEVGNGTQKIVESEAPNLVKNEMTFDGFDGKSYAEFIIAPAADKTKVTWTYDGDMTGFYKIFGMMMDKMLGSTYEQGLANLKNLVESKFATQPMSEQTSADSVISSNN